MFKFEGLGKATRYPDGSGVLWVVPVTVFAETAEEAHQKIKDLWDTYSNIQSSLTRADELPPEAEPKVEQVLVEAPPRLRGSSVRTIRNRKV